MWIPQNRMNALCEQYFGEIWQQKRDQCKPIVCYKSQLWWIVKHGMLWICDNWWCDYWLFKRSLNLKREKEKEIIKIVWINQTNTCEQHWSLLSVFPPCTKQDMSSATRLLIPEACNTFSLKLQCCIVGNSVQRNPTLQVKWLPFCWDTNILIKMIYASSKCITVAKHALIVHICCLAPFVFVV